MIDQWSQEISLKTDAILSTTKEIFQGFPSVSQVVLDGTPAHALIEHITKTRPQLVIMGRRGHHLLNSLVLGSVSLAVLTHSIVPVLVVPPDSSSAI